MRSLDAIREIDRVLRGNRLVIVAGLGRASYCVERQWPAMSCRLDSMGDAIGVAVGIGLGLDESLRVHMLAVVGDGSFLFSLESMLTITSMRKELPNFTVVVIDNGIYESGGGLRTSSRSVDWRRLVEAFDLRYGRVSDVSEVETAMNSLFPIGLLHLIVEDKGDIPAPLAPWNGREGMIIFRQWLDVEFGVKTVATAQKY